MTEGDAIQDAARRSDGAYTQARYNGRLLFELDARRGLLRFRDGRTKAVIDLLAIMRYLEREAQRGIIPVEIEVTEVQ